jgi:hypothetical protein
MGKNKYKETRSEIQRRFAISNDIKSRLISDSTSKIRFSLLDTIHPVRKVKIFVEGKTDVEILEHAFMVLTNGSAPYWKITMATNGDSGSASMVSKVMESAISFKDDYDKIIGIFDHDAAGLKEYRYFQQDYNELKVDQLKMHKQGINCMIVLPVPYSMRQYLQDKQEFNYFAIEHYFGHDFLNERNMLRNTPIADVYEICKKRKAAFANSVRQIHEPLIFQNFVELFKTVDLAANVRIDYDI